MTANPEGDNHFIEKEISYLSFSKLEEKGKVMENYKTIKTFNDSVEANLALNYLQENGLNVVLADEFAGEIFSNVVRGIKLNVHIDDYEKAEELLQHLPAEEFDFEEDPEAESIRSVLEECEALCEGHFQLTSGLHSDKYIEKIKIIQFPEKVSLLCQMLSQKLSDTDPDIVVGLAMGGIALGYEVAKQMGKQFVFSQRKEGEMTIRSGFRLKKGMKALIIEDIVTTGGSVKEVITLLRSLGLDVEAIGLLVDRSGGKVDFGIRTEALLSLDILSYKPEDCPLCKDNVPLNRPGSSDK